MQLYEHSIRKTPWTRGHIVLAFSWCVLFTSAMMRVSLAALHLLFDASAEALMAFFSSGLFLILSVALLDVLKSRFYFQEIINDFSPHNDRAYDFGDRGDSQRWSEDAQNIMSRIEDAETEPMIRHELRIGLRKMLESPSCPHVVRERVLSKHGYLNVELPATDRGDAA